jgi:hypothetical protein
MCDSEGDDSVMISSKINSSLIENKDFPIPICQKRCSLILHREFNGWSLRSILFKQFCFAPDDLDFDDHMTGTRSVFDAEEFDKNHF